MNTWALAIVNDESKSAAPLRVAIDPSALSPGDIQSMLVSLAESDIKLATLRNLMQSLNGMYANAMKYL
ncbi:MAG TPA: hypothetical protein VHW71_16475 [Steroidobacteraceae bacterium]|nr:hypothetical protein [Steroidobacteraceae bacterium]